MVAEVAEGILSSMSTMKERLLGILKGDVDGGSDEESGIQRALTDFVLHLKGDPSLFFLSIGDDKKMDSLWDIDSPEASITLM